MMNEKIKPVVSKFGYVAMNEGEYDISNMTFYNYNELDKAKRHFGKKQKYMKVCVEFYPLNLNSHKGQTQKDKKL